jgi:hypothetical protein
MKTINNYRKNSQYCINGSEIEDMAKILAFFENSVCAIGKNDVDHGDWDYTVRVSSSEGVVDHLVHVSPSRGVSIVQSKVLHCFIREDKVA